MSSVVPAVKKSPARPILAATLAALILGALLYLTRDNGHSQPTALAPTPGETVAITTEHAEIFRRAFWRQPGSANKIIQAERREWADTANEKSLTRWQWFLAVRPSPELLRDLRNPDTFGLGPVAAGTPARPWTSATSPVLPAWFPATADATFEILQSPAAGLTILYRATDHTLYATDQGSGFAPATMPVVPRPPVVPPKS